MKIVLGLAAALIAVTPVLAQSTPAPTPFEAVRGQFTTPGSWSNRITATSTDASFAGRFLIRCDRITGLVQLQRLDVAAPSASMIVSTDSATRSFASTTVRLQARDPLLDAIAFSRGRFVVTGSGGTPLLIPAWPEAARSIEDCRN